MVENLTKTFHCGLFGRQTMHAVREVSFSVDPGESFGLVGNSGSGKSTIARMLVRLIDPTRGRVSFKGTEITALSRSAFRPYRRRLQIIFQQPTLALDPRKSIRQSLIQPLVVHGLAASRAELRERVRELLVLTNLTEEILDRYPCQISGGQAQRVVIARALSLNPEVIIADEPTSMLDISVQAQILDLLKSVQVRRGVTIILISHDWAVVRRFCQRVARLEKGVIVDAGEPAAVLKGYRPVLSVPGLERKRVLSCFESKAQ